jgi:hypothetical protein
MQKFMERASFHTHLHVYIFSSLDPLFPVGNEELSSSEYYLSYIDVSHLVAMHIYDSSRAQIVAVLYGPTSILKKTFKRLCDTGRVLRWECGVSI